MTTDITLTLQLKPWRVEQVYRVCCSVANKQADDLLPAQQGTLARRTSDYEDAIRALWEQYKPMLENGDVSAYDFVREMELIAGETWPAAIAEILDIDEADLTERQRSVISEAEASNRNFLMTSLAPDITRALAEGKGVEGVLDSFDHRIIVMYAGALWGLGSTVTVMFDGLSLRDLADLFMFFGPHDEATCTGPRGCAQYANQVYPVAQILAEEIIPGKMQCYGNCRHFLFPIASFPEAQKHYPGGHDHDQSRHAGDRGRSVPSDAVSFTGVLYHNTSEAALPAIMESGLKPGTGGLGKQADGVYFIRQPVEAGTAREAMLSVNFNDAKLAPTSSKYQEIHNDVKEGLLAEAKTLPVAERAAIRDKAYGDYAFQEAARQFTDLGYDGYEQGWDVVVITNLDLVKTVEREKHYPGGQEHDQKRHGLRAGTGAGASGRARRPEYEEKRLVETQAGSRLSVASYGNINSARRRLERIPDADKYEVVRGEGRYHIVTKAHTTTTPIEKKGKATYKLGQNINETGARLYLDSLGMTPEDLKDTMTTSTADFKGVLKLDSGILRLSGDFHDAETGEFMGSASRLYFKRDGQLVAYNSWLAINPDYQGRGLGSDLYDSQLRTLKRVGFDRVELHANGSVGKYAWGRKGFDFRDDSVLQSANVRIKRWAKARGYDDVPTFTSAKEIADWSPGRRLTKRNFRIQNDAVKDNMVMHAGKAFMLDENGLGSWDAYLDLKE